MAALQFFKFFTPAITLGLIFSSLGCSSAKKKTVPELSQMLGKKVALVEILGEATARQATEVALINQLTERGSFEILSKQQIELARSYFAQDPSDWQGIAKRAGADYALKARVLEFESDEKEGYSKEVIEDSQMKAETGDGKSERLYKVKALNGKVKVELQFADLAKSDIRTGIAEETAQALADEKTGAAHLPPRLSFLSGLLEKAFHRFFERYQ
jgi:hypothetical protein